MQNNKCLELISNPEIWKYEVKITHEEQAEHKLGNRKKKQRTQKGATSVCKLDFHISCEKEVT